MKNNGYGILAFAGHKVTEKIIKGNEDRQNFKAVNGSGIIYGRKSRNSVLYTVGASIGQEDLANISELYVIEVLVVEKKKVESNITLVKSIFQIEEVIVEEKGLKNSR